VTARIIITTHLIALAAIAANGQTKKTRKVAKPKPIRVTVTVKGGGPPVKPLANETDDGVWNLLELKNDDLQILFPAKNEDIFDDVVGPVRSFVAETKTAKYLLAIRDVGVPIDVKGTEEYLENLIKIGFGDADTKIIEKRNLSYGGWLGKQLITEQRAKRSISRIYILNRKLFAMSVILNTKDYNVTFEKWITKFLDSFHVKVRTPREA